MTIQTASAWTWVLDSLEHDIVSFEDLLELGIVDGEALPAFAPPAHLGRPSPDETERAIALQARLNSLTQNAERQLRALAEAVSLVHNQAMRGDGQPPLYFDFQA